MVCDLLLCQVPGREENTRHLGPSVLATAGHLYWAVTGRDLVRELRSEEERAGGRLGLARGGPVS